MIVFIILVSLFIATYTDIKTKTIPVFLFPAISLIGVIYLSYQRNYDVKSSFLFALFTFISYLILALFFNGGGGDIIMMTSLALLFNKEILYVILISHTIMCIVSFVLYVKRKKKETLPFAPFVLVAYIIYLIGGFFIW